MGHVGRHRDAAAARLDGLAGTAADQQGSHSADRGGFAGQHLGSGAFTGTDRTVDPPAHDRRALGARPMDAPAGFTQGVAEFGQHTGSGVADHSATGVPVGGPVLLVEFAVRLGFSAEAIDELAVHASMVNVAAQPGAADWPDSSSARQNGSS